MMDRSIDRTHKCNDEVRCLHERGGERGLLDDGRFFESKESPLLGEGERE